MDPITSVTEQIIGPMAGQQLQSTSSSCCDTVAMDCGYAAGAFGKSAGGVDGRRFRLSDLGRLTALAAYE